MPLISFKPPSGIPAAVGANDGTEESDEETDEDEDPVETRNRYLQKLRGIRPTDDIQRPARGNAPLYNRDYVMSETARLEWPVNWNRIDALNAKVPHWANFTVDSQSLTREYEKTGQNGVTVECNFVSYYRHRSLTAEHRFKQ